MYIDVSCFHFLWLHLFSNISLRVPFTPLKYINPAIVPLSIISSGKPRSEYDTIIFLAHLLVNNLRDSLSRRLYPIQYILYLQKSFQLRRNPPLNSRAMHLSVLSDNTIKRKKVLNVFTLSSIFMLIGFSMIYAMIKTNVKKVYTLWEANA